MIQSLTSSCYELFDPGAKTDNYIYINNMDDGMLTPFHLQITLNWGSSGYAGGYYCTRKGLWQMKERAKENLRKFNSGNSASGAEKPHATT